MFNSFNYSKEDLSCCPNYSLCNDINIEERTQLSIITDADTICDLLSTLECEKISLNGYSYLNLHDNCNLFTFVVGNNKKQTPNDVRTVECLLNKWCIDYVSSKTLKISLPYYSKNIFAKIFCKLSENLDIYSSYIGEDNSLYIESSNNKKAINCIKSIFK